MAEVIIRADSSSEIGTGHIMRDLVLAKEFESAVFAVRDLRGSINHRITAAGFPFEVLSGDSAEELAQIIKKHGAKTLVIDHYGIDYEYEQRIKEFAGVKIFCLDDTYEKHLCDVLLNHNVYADAKRYEKLVPDGCEVRCGAEYTLLRDEFIAEKLKGRAPDNKSVFIAMGGADTAGLNEKILDVLEDFPELTAHVVTTSANAGLESLKKRAEKGNVCLHADAVNIAKIMNSCGFCIVTPSVTLNEVFYMEIPFIAVKTADNQRFMVDYLREKGFRVFDGFDADKMKDSISMMLKDMG
ncbi:UDP-2,4-diacetamido-2,4,6-trideoxy-beta-L-altropyranose hydrolase [Sphaerochaeta sp.]|uniref:UDP-2,4-diacetamido-2,4, 6-trideoxy-beta-L-altropyranose hydrolase n=1 Tax=Sphaerochaeta sp. TaxID=1972642 RepID=UPI003D0A58A3